MSEKLTGGYINDVSLTSGVVNKHFTGDNLTGIPSSERLFREKSGLLRFGGLIAPHFIQTTDHTIQQEFVPGISYEEAIQQSDMQKHISSAALLLKQIHSAPIVRTPQYLQEDFYKKIKKYSDKARPILETYVQKPLRFDIDWNAVFSLGTTYVHRDFWLGNIINGKVIDWEYSGIGSPYEDFAITELWIFMEYGGRDTFYKAYGKTPDQQTVLSYLKARCIQFLSTATPDTIEHNDESGFYHNKIQLLNEL